MRRVKLSFINFSLLLFKRSGSQIFQDVAFVLRAKQGSYPHVTEHRSRDPGVKAAQVDCDSGRSLPETHVHRDSLAQQL